MKDRRFERAEDAIARLLLLEDRPGDGASSAGNATRRNEALIEQLREIARPRGPRASTEFLALVEGEREAWSREDPRDVAALKDQLRRIVGAPDPQAFASAEQYAVAFAAWLAESDARLEYGPAVEA